MPGDFLYPAPGIGYGKTKKLPKQLSVFPDPLIYIIASGNLFLYIMYMISFIHKVTFVYIIKIGRIMFDRGCGAFLYNHIF